MPRVHEEEGFTVRIYTDDHPPPHVHVEKSGGSAKLLLVYETEWPPVVAWRGLSAREMWRAARIVARERERLLDEWRTIHGEPYR